MNYKVMRYKDGRLWSTRATWKLEVTYSEKGWTLPESEALELGFGLLYFIDLERAKEYAILTARKLRSSLEIWECEIGREMPLPKRSAKQPWAVEILETILQLNERDEPEIAEWGEMEILDDWFVGSHMTNRIRLTKRVIESKDLDW